MTVSETETFITQHITTRQCSCVNARGIPTAAYQVLHLLSCTRWGTHLSGYPPPPARSNRGYPRWGTSRQGTPPGPGLTGGGYPRWGTPPVRPGWGTPPVWTWPGYPPLGVNRLITLPSLVLRTRSVMILLPNKFYTWFGLHTLVVSYVKGYET